MRYVCIHGFKSFFYQFCPDLFLPEKIHILNALFCAVIVFRIRQAYTLSQLIWKQKDKIGVKEEDDLTVRAAKLLKKETGYRGGVCIDIEKNLPMGGGLGGGSSDAATVLVVLNQLWQLGISEQRLMELGVALGADVPVFVKGTSTWAEGVGEKLTTIALPDAWFVIIKPQCHVDTGKIFSANDLTRDSKSITISGFNSGDNQNDCSAVVRKRYIEVEQALDGLDEYGQARLTGTGACVFVQFSDRQSAQDVYSKLASDREVYILCKSRWVKIFNF
ncbi:MAG: 4-(cytidine 5'-diphospho)-2-C-methyl-D-erythritol kinase [Candidatus Methanofishera endochildressiae]|uniref:4-diphosphocytidyl-2-C-methyl-D-erythritol kinase n=1 Tax=Candidatus Methanofishera endochildressiae TaxID=2738884 RepID=A0A7Z0MPK3_9GAMM|nr:4-(cytidine 5'-diphospho)-2-C-methyl-D-erythritol kinase [Candidatus Methanofishera endochildressiae]